jgi:hypothetical protein
MIFLFIIVLILSSMGSADATMLITWAGQHELLTILLLILFL